MWQGNGRERRAGTELTCPLQTHPQPSTLMCLPIWKQPEPLCSRVFSEGFIKEAWLSHSLNMGDQTTTSPPALPSLNVRGRGWNFQTSSPMCGLPPDQLLSWRSGRRASLWITIDTPLLQEMPRILKALCQEHGTKTKYIFPYTSRR